MIEPVDMAKRRQVLADFGEFVLRSDDLDEVLTEACRLVAGALGTHRAKVLEIQVDGRELVVRAGIGWRPDIVGGLRLSMSEASSETFHQGWQARHHPRHPQGNTLCLGRLHDG